MFPLRDHNPTEITPLFTVAIGVVTVLAWLSVQGAGATDAFIQSICALGAVPATITAGAEMATLGLDRCPAPNVGAPALFTSVFLHGSWGHLIGNMWFLWVFGNNIEDSMGHLRFLGFYLLTGLCAAGAQIVMEPTSTVPMVGASGAISGIMGAYLLLYPKARVDTLVAIWVVPLPAWMMLGYWMLLQLSGILTPAGGMGGGVAYGAHIGGFVAGLALIPLFRNPKLVAAKKSGVVLARDELDHRGWY